MYLITLWFGIFLCDRDGIKKKVLFPKDPEKIAEILLKIDKQEIIPEEKRIIEEEGVNVVVGEKRLQGIGTYNPNDLFFKKIKIEPKDFGFTLDLIQRASVILAESKVRKKLESEDLQVIQMVNALDDLIQISNLLSERLDYWSVLPTPEEKIQPFKDVYSTVNEEIKRLEKQIDCNVRKIAPNMSNIAGSLIAARLISLAGGIERLSMLPASTVQLLGAEKAFFRFRKEGGKPPKYGVIFRHSLISNAPKTVRGKIARVLAAKISIAAKGDVFTKNDISKDLKEALDKKIQIIKKSIKI